MPKSCRQFEWSGQCKSSNKDSYFVNDNQHDKRKEWYVMKVLHNMNTLSLLVISGKKNHQIRQINFEDKTQFILNVFFHS